MAQFGDGGGGTEFGDAEELKGFKPLPDDLRPEVRSFVLALRGLFKATGKSLRAFAVYHHISPPSVSRYLKGERIPEKDFLDVLMKSACKTHDREVTAELQGDVYRLHREALLATDPARYRVQMASDRLEDAILQKEEAELRIRDLELSVSGQKHQLRQLEQLKRELEAARAGDGERAAAQIEPYRGGQRSLEEQCSDLREEIHRLEGELARAERERDEARAHCQELEDQLAVAQDEAERHELQEQARIERRRFAEAAGIAEQRMEDLDRVQREADEVRLEAQRYAAERREEADADFERARVKAARAAADFDTALAKRREQAEEELAALTNRRDSINAQLTSVREMLASAHSAAGQPVPAAGADSSFQPFWFAVPAVRPLYGEDGSPTPVAELAPGTWYLAVEQRGQALVAQTQDGRRGVLQDTSRIQRG